MPRAHTSAQDTFVSLLGVLFFKVDFPPKVDLFDDVWIADLEALRDELRSSRNTGAAAATVKVVDTCSNQTWCGGRRGRHNNQKIAPSSRIECVPPPDHNMNPSDHLQDRPEGDQRAESGQEAHLAVQPDLVGRCPLQSLCGG